MCFFKKKRKEKILRKCSNFKVKFLVKTRRLCRLFCTNSRDLSVARFCCFRNSTMSVINKYPTSHDNSIIVV